MKGIMRAILLVAVLCLAGCSSEENPQSVAFSVKEMEVDGSSHRLSIGIVANCPWTITDEKDKTFTETKEGSGSLETTLVVFYNPDFDNKTYTVTLTSQDGTSTDVLTVRQAGQLGLEVGTTGMIEAEGGTFDIPVRTNDDITSIDAPDWITFTSSRGLTGYTYTFTAEPNQTGSVRSGQVTLKGTGTSDTFEVEQDSYAPTGIDIPDLSEAVTVGTLDLPVIVHPEYADLSKLDIRTSDGCSASISKERLNMKLDRYGDFEISMSAEGQELYHMKGEYIPGTLFDPNLLNEYHIEQEVYVDYHYYSGNYVLSSSNPDVIRILDNRSFSAVGLGSATITALHPGSGISTSANVKVEPFTVQAQLEWFGEKPDGSFDVCFAARVSGPKDMTGVGFMVLDKTGGVIIMNQGTIKDYSTHRSISTKTVNIRYDRTKFNNFHESLDGYQFMVSASVGGKNYNKYVLVDTHTTGAL